MEKLTRSESVAVGVVILPLGVALSVLLFLGFDLASLWRDPVAVILFVGWLIVSLRAVRRARQAVWAPADRSAHRRRHVWEITPRKDTEEHRGKHGNANRVSSVFFYSWYWLWMLS